MKKALFNISLLTILFIGNIIIKSYNLYFLLIFASLTIYHIFIFVILLAIQNKNSSSIKYFIFNSILLYLITYFLIYDANPLFYLFTYFAFYPKFIKAVLIILIHTYFLYLYINHIKSNFSNNKTSFNYKFAFNYISNFYFLSDIFNNLKEKKNLKIYSLGLIFFFFFDALLFFNKNIIWIHFNDKKKTLPISSSKNKKFFIATNIFNMEILMDFYISQMKQLINYLGETNVIVSIVENGDSKDKTREHLIDFRKYLNDRKIINKFVLNHEIDDIRKKNYCSLKISRLRIEYYAKLRNKCLELLYELPDIDFNNTVVIFFNDVIFRYEDIINLLSTNYEDYDAVCGFDFHFSFYYDRWVTIDLDGEGLSKYFPYFINKEGQDLVINHQPIRVFSCWNGVIAFKALPLKDKRIQFRSKKNPSLPKETIKDPSEIYLTYYESECTYFNIDLFSLGYTKIFINPNVKVSYEYNNYFNSKFFISLFKHFSNYFFLYFLGLIKKRNKYMSNYSDNKIKLNNALNRWFLENKIYHSNKL